jgi:hypothetical protein
MFMKILTFDSAGNWIRYQVFIDQGSAHAFLNGQYTPPSVDAAAAAPTVQQALDPKLMLAHVAESYQCWAAQNIGRLLELSDAISSTQARNVEKVRQIFSGK